MASKSNILVVDDDSTNREWLVEALHKMGYATFEGSDGQHALVMVRDKSIDLVLMDVEMPIMGGREACRIIKGYKKFSYIPVILMTTRNEQEAKVQGLELGADDYLIKPLNLLELSARIKSMLRLKALHDELQEANRTLAMQNDVLQTLSTTDPLMKIYNRLFFEKRFKYEFQRAQRYSKSLALMELDLDYFKRINDTYGHPFGDLVLQRVAELLITSVRASDIVARWGGEEIVILLPELNLDQAKQAAERIRSIIESTEFCDSDITMRETVSIGVIVYPDSRVYRYQDMFKFVDEALYFAKEAGRNCVRVSLDSKGGDKNP